MALASGIIILIGVLIAIAIFIIFIIVIPSNLRRHLLSPLEGLWSGFATLFHHMGLHRAIGTEKFPLCTRCHTHRAWHNADQVPHHSNMGRREREDMGPAPPSSASTGVELSH